MKRIIVLCLVFTFIMLGCDDNSVYEDEISALRVENSRLELANKELLKEIDDKSNEIAKHITENKELREAADNLTSELKGVKEHVADYLNNIDMLEFDLEMSKHRITSFTDMITIIKTLNKEAQKELFDSFGVFNIDELETGDSVIGFTVGEVAKYENGLIETEFIGDFIMSGTVAFNPMTDGMYVLCDESEIIRNIPLNDDYLMNYSKDNVHIDISNYEQIKENIPVEIYDEMTMDSLDGPLYRGIFIFDRYDFALKGETCVGDSINLKEILYFERIQ